MIAPAALPLVCGSCAIFIDPGQSYVVTPDVAGVGADVVECMRCGIYEGAIPTCAECSEEIDGEARAYHDDCAPDKVHCSQCGEALTLKELGKVECAGCGEDAAE